MSTESDRRAPHAARIPFEAMVEVGGALGPSFEAQAVNLSEEGMQLRTAYLPEIGQPVTCRFDAGNGQIVVAAGEVLWNEEVGDGGEFGIRFTNLDTASAAALQRILGVGDGAGAEPVRPIGRKVRLHIEGLASPMRARVKDANDRCLTAFSDLGFLQVGKPLELEDATTGAKRPAVIDGVAVELEQASRIPQLVVSLRYDEEPARVGLDSEAPVTIEAPVDAGPAPLATRASIDMGEAHDVEVDGDEDPREDEDEVAGEPPHHEAAAMAAAGGERAASRDELSDEPENLKSPFARTAAKVTPALEKWAKRARTTVALLAARRRGGTGDDVAVPMRRTTAPAPGGGLHASGRKVVRGELLDDPKPGEAGTAGVLAGKVTKRRAAVAGAVGVAVLLGLVATRKPAPAPSAPVEDTAVAASPVPAEPPPAPSPVAPAAPVMPAAAPALDPMASAVAEDTPSEPPRPQRKVKVAPFGNGPVGRNGNVLRLKMDGAVEKIHGASQPTGFTVVIPDRKSLDAASPLAAKDPRIAAIRVANEPSGAELSVTFKDGVPNYLVRASGDNLELVLARPAQNGDKPAAAHATPKKKPRSKRR